MVHILPEKMHKNYDTFNYIGISIDGIGEVHDYFRGQKAHMIKVLRL